MRLSLEPTPFFTHSITLPPPSKGDPPLAFIDNEPFVIELQGSLELPEARGEGSGIEGAMAGVTIGKLNLSEPSKPILQVAHHRLEGRVETLSTPFALLKTTPIPTRPPTHSPPPSKRPRLSSSPTPMETENRFELGAPTSSPEKQVEKIVLRPKIEIVGLVRRKIVFSKRPEPIIELSSEIEIPVA